MTNKDLHSILIYGPSGLGKSTLIAALIRELLPKCPAGTKARVVTTEHYKAYKKLCEEGLAEVWKINSVDHPFESSRFAMDGFWPSIVVDGVADATSPLAKPPASALNVFEGIATLGLYVAGDYVKGGLADRIGQGEIFGPSDSSDGPITLHDGEVSFGKLSGNNYGFIQTALTGMIQRSQRRGGYNIWSTHEDDVDEKIGNERTKTLKKTGKIIMGPEGFGAAMTQKMGRDFDDMWRLVAIPVRVEVPGEKDRVYIERRLYVKEHICPTYNVIAKAKNSAVESDEVPEYFRLTDKEDGRQGLKRKDVAGAIVGRLGL